MKYQVRYSKAFKKGLKKLKNDPQSLELVNEIITKLANDETLEAKYKDHTLSGTFESFKECHIKPDYLLFTRSMKIYCCLVVSR